MTGWKEQADQVTGTDTNLADFILNGPDDGAAGQLRDQYRNTCDRFSNAPDWSGSLSDASFNSISDACEPYLGDQGFDVPIKQPPPFEGGQCPIQYSISYEIRTRTSRFTVCGTFGAWTTGNNVVPAQAIFGPITGLEARQFDFTSTFGDKGQDWILSFHTASGTPTQAPLNLNGTAGRPFASNCGPSVELRNFQVTPLGGLSDNCGSLPPVITPVNPAPDPGPSPSGNPSDNPDNPNDPIIPVPLTCGEGTTTCVLVEYTDGSKIVCGSGCLYWGCFKLEAGEDGPLYPSSFSEDTIIGQVTDCNAAGIPSDQIKPGDRLCTTTDPNFSYYFVVFDGDGNVLYDRIECCCPQVNSSVPPVDVGFVCTCPDWGRSTSYNQTLFSPSVRLREWVQSNAGARADCKHIMAAKRIMGIDQPTYTDPPYSAPPPPSTPG